MLSALQLSIITSWDAYPEITMYREIHVYLFSNRYQQRRGKELRDLVLETLRRQTRMCWSRVPAAFLQHMDTSRIQKSSSNKAHIWYATKVILTLVENKMWKHPKKAAISDRCIGQYPETLASSFRLRNPCISKSVHLSKIILALDSTSVMNTHGLALLPSVIV